jgi:hypothetical protein
VSAATEAAGAKRDGIITSSLWGTAVFAVSAGAAAVFPDVLAVPSLAIALVLFLLGCLAFVRALLLAAGRSRRDEIDLAGLFFLSRSAPNPVRVRLLGAFAAQIVIALVTAFTRPFSALAFGVLVPTYGLGLCGLWAARSGTFPRRVERVRPPRSRAAGTTAPSGDEEPPEPA